MTPLATIEAREASDGRLVAVLVGEVDASNVDDILRRLESLLTVSELTLDLTELDYLDSAGVRALYVLAEAAGVRRTRVAVSVPDRSPVRRVLDVAGVPAVLPVGPPSRPLGDGPDP